MCRQQISSSAVERSSCCVMFLRKLSCRQRKLLNAAISQLYCVAVSVLSKSFQVKTCLINEHTHHANSLSFRPRAPLLTVMFETLCYDIRSSSTANSQSWFFGEKNMKNVVLSVVSRLLAEEEEKMKALMSLQEEQEEYILKTQREKQELKQEMETKSRDLEEAQRQLEEVRANRHRVDQDVVVRTKT